MGQKAAGSILIFVLWVLALASLLAQQYLLHNREQGSLIKSAWRRYRYEVAADSAVQLFSSGSFEPLLRQAGQFGKWVRLDVGGVLMWVKWDSESSRVNLNTASDERIRDTLLELFGDESGRDAGAVADAILDWRDDDDLVRINGAEASYYESVNVSYRPADGPFKALTELLLVKGVTERLFWGDPYQGILNELQADQEEISEQGTKSPSSILESFTIYGKNVMRLTIVLPWSEKVYGLRVVLFEHSGGKWVPFAGYGREFLKLKGQEGTIETTRGGSAL